MIGQQYKAHKDNVIDLFENYKIKRGDFYDGVDIKFLESRVESLKKGKFTLAVAGEVKAGKSTFINALLGSEILPSDVLQASSAIVEIFKSETSFLKVKYASGREEHVYDDIQTRDRDEANERLHEICKIDDNFRDIPTTLIDEYIIYNDNNLIINEAFIKQLQEQSGMQLQDKYEVVKKYIASKSKDTIPVEIEFGYPMKWDFDELRIVDSPGVNATGGVQDISFRFFEEANAILFVHPIKPIESESFRKFVDTIISNHSKETLFLILTHAGLYSDTEVERLYAEAKRLYQNIIPESRILVVDSLLQLIYKDFENGKTLEEIESLSEQKADLIPKFERKARKEEVDLASVIKKYSRFEEMFCAIDQFSMKAPNLQLQEILEKIKAGYLEQETLYTEKVERLEKKKKNPQEFEEEINRISEALENYRILKGEIKEDLITKYVGNQSLWVQEIQKIKSKYPELITKSDSIESVKKNMLDGLNAIREIANKLSKEVTENLEDILKETGNTFRKDNHISIPKVDLMAIEEAAKKTAYKEKKRYEIYYEKRWYTLWLFKHKQSRFAGMEKVFDNNKFLSNYQINCQNKFYTIVDNLPKISGKVIERQLELFSKKMDSVIDDRQKALNKEKDKMQLNKKIIDEINDLNRKKNDIQPEKSRCIEVLENIK